ncbi:tripartite tricarboxylate transporter permease [Arthrobacter sp. UNC362MFTsu5.1]|uniref:tripartite tricarboxylate transporter permease n=1 Tax=Arthrobacter sp. UNC362MFTsu5.1 TaxID=1449044 RepID=UPI0005B8CAC4|nr:tripartite tricarboxylate transporter permease [Arthrobacter sp. UNC362MFTsu5.1]
MNDSILLGFSVALDPMNLLAVLAGCLLGVVVGVLPGLGPITTISILLPFTYAMEPTTAIILLAGIYAGVMYGGTVTSVLLKLPGEAASVVTAIDGYEMARKGRAGPALGISAIGSFIGATVALIALTFFAPALAELAVKLGPPEYAMLALLGLLLIAYLGAGAFAKAVVAAAIGLFLATVGLDPISGDARFVGDSLQLLDGMDVVAVVLGLFGIGEVLFSLRERDSEAELVSKKVGRVWPTKKDLRDSAAPIARGSVIGTLVGLVPGGGGLLSSLLSYGAERRFAKNPEEFGKGAIQGVAGPETANNASSTSSFIPLLSLGIPFNVTISLLFSVLLINGITPGPRLVTENPDLFWGVIASMYLGNVVLLILSLPLVGLLIQILRVDMAVLSPFIIVLSLVGVYTIDNNTWNMWVALFFGVVGYFMRIWGFPPGPLVLAFILGGLLETSLRQSLLLGDEGLLIFLQRPGSLALIAVSVLLIGASTFSAVRKRRAQTGAVEESIHVGS